MIPIWKLSGRLGNQMFRHAYIYTQMRNGRILDEYVQNPEYFEMYSDEIKHMFGTGIGSIDRVCLQVRRGDYVNNPYYVDLMKTDYYQKAMAMFPNEKFLVFSDDIEWCKQQEIFKDCEFNINKEDWEDINSIASCNRGHIIANGSFGWWGAYLSPHNTKVVAPSVNNWYSDGIERTKCPKKWTRI